MSKREWTLLQVLSYLYNAFATFADGKLDDSEIKEMAILLSGWTPGEESDLEQVVHIIVEARERIAEDIKGSSDEKDLVNETLSFCLDAIKENWEEQQYISVIQDMINIGLADGNYDASEQGWVEMVADKLGIDPPSVEQAMDERGRDTADVEDEGSYDIFPKHWKDEHVIVCLVRHLMIIGGPVTQEEMDCMGNIGSDYYADDIDVSGVWDGVDDDILKILPEGTNENSDIYFQLVTEAISYVDQYFEDNNKETLLIHLTNMAVQTKVVEYTEYLTLKQCVEKWSPGQFDFDATVNTLENSGIVVVKNDPSSESNTNTIQQLVVLPDGKSVDLWDTKYWNLGAISYPMDDKEMIHRLVKPFSDPSNSHILLYPIDVQSSPHLQYFAYAGKAYKYIEAWKNASRTGNFKTKIYLFDMITKYYYSQEIDHGEFGDGYFVDEEDGDEYREDQFEENIPDSIKGKYQLLRDLGLIEFKERFFDTEGRPIEKTDHSDDTEVPKEKTVSRKETKKPQAKKKLTLHEQLASELTKLYPTADVKKVDDGNYLDIHMPDIHPKRGTHIWFNTPKAGGIKVGFFCRDKDFIEDALKRNSATIETYSNGLRLLGHPTFKKVDDAIKVADNFVKMLL